MVQHGYRCAFCQAPLFSEEDKSFCCKKGSCIAPTPWRNTATDYPPDTDIAKVTQAKEELLNYCNNTAKLKKHARDHYCRRVKTKFQSLTDNIIEQSYDMFATTPLHTSVSDDGKLIGTFLHSNFKKI